MLHRYSFNHHIGRQEFYCKYKKSEKSRKHDLRTVRNYFIPCTEIIIIAVIKYNTVLFYNLGSLNFNIFGKYTAPDIKISLLSYRIYSRNTSQRNWSQFVVILTKFTSVWLRRVAWVCNSHTHTQYVKYL